MIAPTPTAVVVNVQRFSLHDGPGVRTTVFLKGCPLSCAWCHNPESMEARPQLAIKADRCLGCGACVPVCPVDLAGPVTPGSNAHRPDETCLHCGNCADACPSGARELIGKLWSVEDLVAEIERDRPYFTSSGGGVTFSGGEPAAPVNAAFTIACLDALKERGLHRTVDTCGHADPDDLAAVAARADLVLYDLKIMDPHRHQAVCGVDNARILANLRRLSDAGHELRVRVPLIGGLTDDDANLEAIADFVAALPRPCPIDLLPYHGLGADKYGRLGLDYALTQLADMDPDSVTAAARLLSARGLDVVCGD